MLRTRNLILIVGVVALLSATVQAQTSNYFFTSREYKTGLTGFSATPAPPSSPALASAPPAGLTGNPVVFLQPPLPAPNNRHIRGTDDTSSTASAGALNKSVQLWMHVQEKYTGGNDQETMSSLGVDVRSDTDLAPAGTNTFASFPAANLAGTLTTTYTQYTEPSNTNGAGSQMWDGFSMVGTPSALIDGAGDTVANDAREVTVPPDVAGFGNGGVPTADTVSYRVAKIDFQAKGPGGAAIGCRGQLPTRYKFFLRVGNLLITRVVNPAYGGAITQESVAFGYNGGAAEAVPIPGLCTAGASGSCVGAESGNADLRVDERFKGDASGGGAGFAFPDGVVDGADTGAFNNTKVAGASAALDRKFTYDYAGGGAGFLEPDGIVDGADSGPHNTQKKVWSGAGGEPIVTPCP